MKHLGKIQALVAMLVIAGFFFGFWLLLKNDVDSSMRDALLIMIGALGSAFGAVINYYFGSSSGSTQKTELLATKETP